LARRRRGGGLGLGDLTSLTLSRSWSLYLAFGIELPYGNLIFVERESFCTSKMKPSHYSHLSQEQQKQDKTAQQRNYHVNLGIPARHPFAAMKTSLATCSNSLT
jgi:hypothetical protein